MAEYKLFMILLGCKPTGRNIEQHDIFFGIATKLNDLKDDIKSFWKDSGKIHIDGYKTISNVNGYQINIKQKEISKTNSNKLFFINLGGYKKGDFEEYHYKTLIVSDEKNVAIKMAKENTFFKHFDAGANASAHIDDKYGIDIDDIYTIDEVLSTDTKAKFSIHISKKIDIDLPEDELYLGYLKLTDI